MPKKKIHIEAGTCPKCGGVLDYGSSEVEDGSYGYEWTCPDCGASGTEWHRLEFSSHAVLKKGKHIKYETFDAVLEPIVILVKSGVATVDDNPTENPVVIKDLD